MQPRIFRFNYAKALVPLFAILGVGPRVSRVEVEAGRVRVRMGWAFSADVPRASIRSVAPDTHAVTGWGVHGWRGQWLVNGSSQGLVRVTVEPVARARVLGVVPVRLRVLRLSLTEPGEFIAELAPVH